MRELNCSWRATLVGATLGALVGLAPAGVWADDKPVEKTVRVQKLSDGKMQVIVGEGQAVTGPGSLPEQLWAEIHKEVLKRVAAALEKAGLEGEKLQAVMRALEAEQKARHQAGPAKGQPEAAKPRVMVLQLHDKDGTEHARASREKMVTLVKRQQELIEQAGQVVKKMQGLKEGQLTEAKELTGQFERVQAQLRQLTEAVAAARSVPEARGIQVELRGAGQFQSQGGQSQSQSQSQGGGEKKVIVNVVPKPGAEGPTTAGGKLLMTLPAPAPEIKELKEQMKALKEQVEDMRAMLKALADRQKAREKP